MPLPRMTVAELQLRVDLYSIDTGLMTTEQKAWFHRKANNIIPWNAEDRKTAAAIVKGLAGMKRPKKPRRRVKQ